MMIFLITEIYLKFKFLIKILNNDNFKLSPTQMVSLAFELVKNRSNQNSFSITGCQLGRRVRLLNGDMATNCSLLCKI